MTEDEYAAGKVRVQAEAKDNLFSIGQPFVYAKNGNHDRRIC